MGIQINGLTDTIQADDGSISIGGTVTYEDISNISFVGIATFTSDVLVADRVVHAGDTNTTIRFPAADTITAETSGSERLRIDSSGNLIIGTTTAATNAEVTVRAASPQLSLYATPGNTSRVTLGDTDDHDIGQIGYDNSDNSMFFATNAATRMSLDSSGRLGLGTNSPEEILHVKASSETVGSRDGVLFESSSSLAADTGLPLVFTSHIGNAANYGVASIAGRKENVTSGNGAGYLQFSTGSSGGAISERIRIDSSGRLLVGTSSARENFINISGISAALQVEGVGFNDSSTSIIRNSASANAPFFILGKTRSGSVGGTTVVQNNDPLGVLSFQGIDGSEFVEGANIKAEVNGTPGANDMPGRLVFSTTADGASTPTERMRIDSSGTISLGNLTTPASANIHLDLYCNSSYDAFIRFRDQSGAPGLIGFDHGSNAMQFYTNGSSEAMRIDSSGNLTVGPFNIASSTGYGARVAMAANAATVIAQCQQTASQYTVLFGGYQGSTRNFSVLADGHTRIGTDTGLGSHLTVSGSQASNGVGVAEIRNTANSNGSPALVISKTKTDTSSSARFVQFYANNYGTPMGGIVGSGASAVQFASISDVREKENIQSLTGSLEKVKQLEVVEFDWKESGEHVKAGFTAQNVETVFPEYVVDNLASEGMESRKGVTGGLSGGYIAVLTAALQEAVSKIETLEQRLSDAGIA